MQEPGDGPHEAAARAVEAHDRQRGAAVASAAAERPLGAGRSTAPPGRSPSPCRSRGASRRSPRMAPSPSGSGARAGSGCHQHMAVSWASPAPGPRDVAAVSGKPASAPGSRRRSAGHTPRKTRLPIGNAVHGVRTEPHEQPLGDASTDPVCSPSAMSDLEDRLLKAVADGQVAAGRSISLISLRSSVAGEDLNGFHVGRPR